MNKNIGNYRWRIVFFLFFATTINYIDRQIIGILAPELQKYFGWTEKDYGFITMSFQTAYAIGLLISGYFLDKIGTKIGYFIAMFVWSIASSLHGFATSVLSFSLMRFLLGFGQSFNFPAAVKVVTEWFPKRERALATGIFNTGSNFGAITSPLVIPILAINFGWKLTFIISGGIGIIWLIFWYLLYNRPEMNKNVSEQEKEYILQDSIEIENKVSWKKIIFYKQTFGICISRFVTDPIWWFFLFWLPKFLNSKFNVNLSNIGLPLIFIYIVSIIGSLTGGWLSSFLIKRNWKPITARKITVFIMALLVIPVFFASIVNSLWIAIILIGLATFAHQGYAANIFTIVSDVFPKNVVGTVVGLSGFAGALGGILFAGITGLILEYTRSYYPIFIIASIAYIVCWLSLKLFVPDNELIKV